MSDVTAGDWIAVYAAVVGTAALVWQAATYVHERRPRLRVDFMLFHFLETKKEQRAVIDKPPIIETPWRLQIEVLNLGYSTVHVGKVRTPHVVLG